MVDVRCMPSWKSEEEKEEEDQYLRIKALCEINSKWNLMTNQNPNPRQEQKYTGPKRRRLKNKKNCYGILGHIRGGSEGWGPWLNIFEYCELIEIFIILSTKPNIFVFSAVKSFFQTIYIQRLEYNLKKKMDENKSWNETRRLQHIIRCEEAEEEHGNMWYLHLSIESPIQKPINFTLQKDPEFRSTLQILLYEYRWYKYRKFLIVQIIRWITTSSLCKKYEELKKWIYTQYLLYSSILGRFKVVNYLICNKKYATQNKYFELPQKIDDQNDSEKVKQVKQIENKIKCNSIHLMILLENKEWCHIKRNFLNIGILDYEKQMHFDICETEMQWIFHSMEYGEGRFIFKNILKEDPHHRFDHYNKFVTPGLYAYHPDFFSNMQIPYTKDWIDHSSKTMYHVSLFDCDVIPTIHKLIDTKYWRKVLLLLQYRNFTHLPTLKPSFMNHIQEVLKHAQNFLKYLKNKNWNSVKTYLLSDSDDCVLLFEPQEIINIFNGFKDNEDKVEMLFFLRRDSRKRFSFLLEELSTNFSQIKKKYK